MACQIDMLRRIAHRWPVSCQKRNCGILEMVQATVNIISLSSHSLSRLISDLVLCIIELEVQIPIHHGQDLLHKKQKHILRQT